MRQHTLSFPPESEDLQSVTHLFQALSDPTRLLLLLALHPAEQSVSDLTTKLKQPQSTISRHLATLRHAGLVITRRAGPRVYYRLADSHLSKVLHEAFSHAEHQRLGLTDQAAPETVRGSVH